MVEIVHERQSFKWTKYRIKYWVIWRDNRIAKSAVKKLTDTYDGKISKTYQILYVESMKITNYRWIILYGKCKITSVTECIYMY